MFSSLQSPCYFDSMPSMFVDPMFLSQEPKRRRVHNGSMRIPSSRNVRQNTPVPLRYKVTETERGYVLSLHKKLPKNLLRNEINYELSMLKDQLYRPTYHYCGFFGDLVEEQADEDSLTDQAISRLNVDAICRRVARQAFKNYKIELNHRGDELSITNRADGVAKEFDLGIAIDDLEVMGCYLDESYSHAVWKILLVKETDANSSNGNSPEDRILEDAEPYEQKVDTQEQKQEQKQEEGEEEQRLESEPTIQEPEESTPLKIDINFPQDQNSQQHKRTSPILEEVEDEEVSRFRQLSSRAPTGSAILEDY
ncbi:hypothetical protein ZYGM_003500 [Zygosaccharomyces mellis]|uniref:Uncharacterized protein n=1 Tax=Zygosaccharomyces mellis TaxID=42258 RepID=A0A4C2E503_9SACH|nr:hypothetical protein ZYGM_003500 [Zygosaccharomyces mellis]